MRTMPLILVLLTVLILYPAIAQADNGPNGTYDPYGSHTTVSVSVTTTSTGIYIQVSVTQTRPGNKTSPTTPVPVPTIVPVPSPIAPKGSPTSSNDSGTRTWSDATGIYEQTPDGNLYYLTIPNISSQGDWPALLQQHPNQIPYVLYVNNQLEGILWIPSSTDSQPLQFGPAPAVTPIPGPPPAGSGSSTNPYQVALNLLDHVPLPNIQIKENPGLGLVNLPGWFWVDGYDGKPFGTSQTVTVPPAVGPDVPLTDVPANDPRRQPTYFTVSVQVWPTSYQWGFGDGATLVTQSLGQAYPAQSDIQHTYQFSSLQTQGGFPVQVTVVFAAQFQVNGGGAQGLPSMAHTYASAYPVQEAQALLTSH